MSFLSQSFSPMYRQGITRFKTALSTLFQSPTVSTIPPIAVDQSVAAALAAQQAAYKLLWELFTGEYWKATDPETKQEKWKVKVNKLQAACFIHAAVCAGEIPSTSEPIVRPVVAAKQLQGGKVTKKAEGIAAETRHHIEEVWRENGGRSRIVDAFTVAQALGGVLMQLRYEPERHWRRAYPICIEFIRPDYFYGVASGSDYFDLLQAWIVRQISLTEAQLLYGYQPTKFDDNKDSVEMVEYWDKGQYEIMVDGQTARFKEEEMRGENPYGFVPMVYAPHLRAGQFTGISLIQQLVGVAEEINDMAQLLGDSLNNAVNEDPWIRDVQGRPETWTINGRRFLNLKSSTQFTKPHMERMNPPQAGQMGRDYLTWLDQVFDEIAYAPDIAWGQDQGSQRSSSSRQLLLFPLTEHIKMERLFWSEAFNTIDEMIIQMLGAIRYGKVDEDHYRHRISQSWHLMYSPEREKLVTELQLRGMMGYVSQETALQRFGDYGSASELEDEIRRIDDFKRRQAEWGKPQGNPGADFPMVPDANFTED